MLNRLWLAFAVSLLVSTQRAIEASPITYDFTGTLYQPVDGVQTFSGSFTINADPTGLPGAQSVTESGSDVSVTLNLGGQVISYVNTPQNPSFVAFQVFNVAPGNEVPPGSPTYEVLLSGGFNGDKNPFGFTSYIPGEVQQLSNLRDLSFPLETSSVDVSGMSGKSYGPITSIEAVSAPEPSSLVVFAALGMGMMVLRRRGGSSGRSPRRAG